MAHPDADLAPNYCPSDGSSVVEDVDEASGLSRWSCPECDQRWYGGALPRLAFRLPPSARPKVVEFARVLVERPRPSPKLTLIRLGLLGTIVAALVAWVPGDVGTGVAIVGGIALFLLLDFTRVLDAQSTFDEDGSRFSRADIGIVAAAGVVNHELLVEQILRPGWSLLLDVARNPVESVAWFDPLWLLLLAVAWIGFSVSQHLSIYVHEWLHVLAFRALGVDARADVYRHMGVAIPSPSTWTGEEWEQAVVSLAPLLMLVPVAILVAALEITAVEFPQRDIWYGQVVWFAIIGIVMGWLIRSFPSGPDLENAFGSGRYTAVEEALNSLDGHRAAEGIDR